MAQETQESQVSLFLKEIYQNSLTGQLHTETDEYQKSLFFSEGKLVYARSGQFDEKILVILHLVGKITEEQYNFISGLHQFSDDQIGTMLLEHKFVGKKDLYYARIYQFRRIAISIFNMQEVKWDFTSLDLPPIQTETYDIPLTGILVEGARNIDRVSPYAGKWLFQIPKPLGGIPDEIVIYFTDEEKAFFAQLLLNPDISCQELISKLNMQPLAFWRKLLAFYLLCTLEMQKAPPGTSLNRDLQELLILHEKIKTNTINDIDLFGLTFDSSKTAIKEAHAQLRIRFSPERFGSAAAPETKKIAETVCQHIDETMKILMPLPRPQTASLTEASPTPIPPTPLPKPRSGYFPLPQDKARDLYMKGKELYGQKEFTEAILFIKQAIKLDPQQGDFYSLLGLCQSEITLFANDAENNLKKAIELQPWNADPVYALGVLFRKQNNLALAERCFRRVKEISREHTGAGQALIDLNRLKPKKKDKLAFLKKKFF